MIDFVRRCVPCDRDDLFELQERHEAGGICLKLIGELDLETAPRLEDRLGQLRAESQTVRVDLSELEFMDSSGLHVLLDAATDARSDGWKLEVRDDLSPQVRRLIELTGVGHFILNDNSGGWR